MATNPNKHNTVFHKLDPEHLLLIRQTNEKLTALFHKVHNLQIEVQASERASRETNALLLRILENPEDRVDASAELAKQRAARIEKYT